MRSGALTEDLMSRINTNVGSLLAQRVLGQNQGALRNSLERLSTGLKINRGKDDPAGLIASESLRAELKSTNAAVDNAKAQLSYTSLIAPFDGVTGIRLLDGFENTAENVHGELPSIFEEASLRRAEQTDRLRTVFGTLALYRAERSD